MSPSCTIFVPVFSPLSQEIISLVLLELITAFPTSITSSSSGFSLLSTFTPLVIVVAIPLKSFIVALICSVLVFSSPGAKLFTFHVTTPFSYTAVSPSTTVEVTIWTLSNLSVGISSVTTAFPATVPLLIAVIS